MYKENITWRDVLDCKDHSGHISAMKERALLVGYQYYVWNDNVWPVDEIGWTIGNLKTLDQLGMK